MSCVYSFVVLQPVRVVAIDWYEGAKVCWGHGKFAVYFVWVHYCLHWVGALDVKDIVVLNRVKKVSIFYSENVEQLVRWFKVVGDHLNVDLATMWVIISLWSPCFDWNVLADSEHDQVKRQNPKREAEMKHSGKRKKKKINHSSKDHADC